MVEILDRDRWSNFSRELPISHLLQTAEWAEIKQRYGWQHKFLKITGVAGASVLLREQRLVPFLPSLKVLYSPRGPLIDWENLSGVETVLDALEAEAKILKGIFIKIDPEVHADEVWGESVVGILKRRGWIPSNDQIQFRNTMWMDLQPAEDELLAAMKQKTRYNIRLAQKKGITVRRGNRDDLPLLYKMFAETSVRDRFVIRNETYYLDVWGTFIDKGMAFPLLAEVEGEMIAGLILFVTNHRAYYLYGMSANKFRERMPNHLLQWDAIRLAKSLGCTLYDLWGAPDELDEQEAMFGVYKFKEGLGSHLVRFIGAWDFPVNKPVYSAYTKVLPKILNIMRAKRVDETRNEVGV